MVKYAFAVIMIAAVICYSFILGRPNSKYYTVTVGEETKAHRKLLCVMIIMTVIISVIPVNWSPLWKEENVDYINQYQLMAESVLEGKLYIDYDDIDEKLINMENPYDTGEREKLGVRYHKDHAFYKGKYYMYFGVVPVFLLFLPFRVITGHGLKEYYAVGVVLAFLILGIFLLIRKFSKQFFKEISYNSMLFLSLALSAMSVWYAASAPSMYSLAIICAVCAEIWSFFFFTKAVYEETEENKSIFYAAAGSLFGALSFGCRPTVALVNIAVIPLLSEYLKKRSINPKLILKLIAAAMPYVVIGVLLMAYNYLRFENPFDFGQAYQLTIADVSSYKSIASVFSLKKELKGVFEFLVYSSEFDMGAHLAGAFITFPVTLLSFSVFFSKKVRTALKEKRILPFVLALYTALLIIMLFDVLYTPALNARYRTDIYWLLGIITFFNASALYGIVKNKMRYNYYLFAFCVFAFAASILLFLIPYDGNFTYCLLHFNK